MPVSQQRDMFRQFFAQLEKENEVEEMPSRARDYIANETKEKETSSEDENIQLGSLNYAFRSVI